MLITFLWSYLLLLNSLVKGELLDSGVSHPIGT